MGQATGFKDYARKELTMRPVEERVKDYKEIKCSSLPHQEHLRQQAARCMDCSVPFCHSGIMLNGMVSGCPLHNLMPEFNDLVYRGLDEFAYARLNKTNNFPEFTSHVCPAPCEGACCAGVVTAPVTVRNIEQYIIENAFEKGFVKPNIPAKRTDKKVAIIGSGPAGLACADQLNKAGHNVTVFERDNKPGGLLMYGIPNMKLDKKVLARRIKLLEDAGITFKCNCEVGHQIPSETLLDEYDAIVVCTGSPVARDIDIPGRDLKGIVFAKDYLNAATKAMLNKKAVPTDLSAKGKDVVIIGGGDTGNDCMAIAIRQGCNSIMQLQHNPCLPHSRAENNPWPEFPRVFNTDYGQEEAIKVFKADPRRYCTNSKEFIADAEGKQVAALKICQNVSRNGQKVDLPDTEEIVPAQLVILAMGYAGTEKRLFEEFKFDATPKNNIAADDKSYMTSVPGVFAAGDSRRGQSLVVWAIAEGRGAAAAVEKYLAGK